MNSHGFRRLIAAGCATILNTLVCAADKPAESTHPIRLVVPTAAGGGTDTLARIIAPKLGEALRQQVIVDNRAGAGGNVGTEIVVRAAPDGNTILLRFNTILTVNPNLCRLSFSMQHDLLPVTTLDVAQFLVQLHPGVQAGTLSDFIALAKAKPGVINYASSGIGGPAHLAAELFKKRAGVSLHHVPYTGGSPSLAAVLSAETQVLFGSVTESMPSVKAGRLSAIANTSATLSKLLPDVPTVAESGFPGFDFSKWDVLLVPAKTPAGVINRLREATIRTLENADVREAVARQGLEIMSSTPQELAARIKTETDIWAAVIKDANIRAD